ncbi:MAG: HAMP domain-containing histidine kinase [Eubacterium sp.]|nr:HAMP domain-containing histidine kinase [Eubacterium sp.]
MKSSMRTRLIVIFSGMLILTICCMCLANLFLLPDFYQRTKVSQMKRVYAQTVDVCDDVDWGSQTAEQLSRLYDQLDTLSSNSNVSIYIMQVGIYSGSGEIATLDYVYPANTDRLQRVTWEQVGKYVKSMYYGTALDENCELLSHSGEYAVYKVYDQRVESNYIELTGQMPNNYWVYLRANYQSIQESAQVSNQFLTHTGIVIVIIGTFIMLFISNQYTKPILRLARHARDMKDLNFSSRYEDERDDEIGVLGSSMNALSDELERTISELKTANNELQVDLDRRSQQEEMRQEFLANVSHELKTPIALIQGYAEGLQENIHDDPESRDFYCEVIVDEAKKMNKMVKKLLNLNQLEFGNGSVHLEHFDLNHVLDYVIHSTEILFQQKEAVLSCRRSREPIMVWADEYMIEEVVMNYVSNALNHVRYDKKIEIKTTLEDGLVRVSVFNTGDPIPEEDLGKIWTKFYKVDKAHTREYGGNGIGLSIVKAVMEAHNQKYGVRNYDNGVEFWFELDIAVHSAAVPAVKNPE